MASAEHKELVPLVEVSLAIMRLACEKFFVLISVLATYLLFRDEAPRPARLLIRLNHRLSVFFQRVCSPCNILSSSLGPCPPGAWSVGHSLFSSLFWPPTFCLGGETPRPARLLVWLDCLSSFNW